MDLIVERTENKAKVLCNYYFLKKAQIAYLNDSKALMTSICLAADLREL